MKKSSHPGSLVSTSLVYSRSPTIIIDTAPSVHDAAVILADWSSTMVRAYTGSHRTGEPHRGHYMAGHHDTSTRAILRPVNSLGRRGSETSCRPWCQYPCQRQRYMRRRCIPSHHSPCAGAVRYQPVGALSPASLVMAVNIFIRGSWGVHPSFVSRGWSRIMPAS